MVVLVHLQIQLRRLGYATYEADWLASGVDIFFVISGFIMWVSVARRNNMTAAKFLQNRIIRIVPLYWSISFVVLGISLFVPWLLHTTVFSPWHALSSFLFIPARHPVTEQFWPLLIPGWTLNMEMMFYLLFALALSMTTTPRTRFIAVALLIIGVTVLSTILSSTVDTFAFYADPRMFEFLAGIMIGVLYLQQRLARGPIWIAGLFIGFFLFRYGAAPVPASASNLFASALIVLSVLHVPTVTIPGLRTLGDASYSLYLTHVISLAAIGKFWSMGLQWAGGTLFSVTALACCVMVAYACFRMFEKPLTNWLKYRSRPRPGGVAAT